MSDTNTELAGLAAMAGQIDGEQAASGADAIVAQAEAEQAIAQANGNTESIAFMLAIAVPMLTPIFPSVGKIYTDETQGAVAGSLGPVLTKYNIDLSAMKSDWGPEIAAVMVCGPIAMMTYKGISEDLAAKKAQAPKAVASNSQKAPETAPETVTLG